MTEYANIDGELSRIQHLVMTGLSMGILHVLAGPDHLSALAALSVGNSWRAFSLGIRWGMGHSSGLMVVAIIFILLKGNLDLRKLGRYCDILVGAFMILLGLYGVLSTWKSYREKHDKSDHDLSRMKSSPIISTHTTTTTTNNNNNSYNNGYSSLSRSDSPKASTSNRNTIMTSSSSTGMNNISSSSQSTEIDTYMDIDASSTERLLNRNTTNNNANNTSSSSYDKSYENIYDTSNSSNTTNNNNNTRYSYSFFHTHTHDHSYHSHSIHESTIMDIEWLQRLCTRYIQYIDMRDPMVQKIVSFSIGLLHGVAGPGGILGVLPAVEMTTWIYSMIYLSTFILASTLSMGLFASLYGEITKRIGATQQLVDIFLKLLSSSMSIFVGTIWFVLSIMGNLDQFFH